MPVAGRSGSAHKPLVGATTARKILKLGDAPIFGAEVKLARDGRELAGPVRPVWKELEDAYAAGKRVMLEGTQGTDLSLRYDICPQSTSRETTAAAAWPPPG